MTKETIWSITMIMVALALGLMVLDTILSIVPMR